MAATATEECADHPARVDRRSHAFADRGAPDPALLEASPDFVLAPFKGNPPPAPDWYDALRAEQPAELRVEVNGAGIEVLAWGDRSKPGILLVHGNRAHARWWGPVAPLLARDYRVASVSLSGMGGSDWRARYSSFEHGSELLAAIEVAGLRMGATRPVIVAHSFGGVAAAAAARCPEANLSGVAFLDCYITPPDLRIGGSSLPARKARHYPDLEAALARFRLSPSQRCDAPYILDDVARAGLIRQGDGWRWRFDPGMMDAYRIEDPWSFVGDPTCPIAFVFGERSPLATPPLVAAQQAHAPAGTPSIGIPEAGHHLMFDQPLAVVAAIRSLALRWIANA